MNRPAPVSPRATRREYLDVMRELGVRPRKSLGQHFLIEPNIVEQILATAEITSSDHVVEIGPGLGVLTRPLAERAGSVTAVEMDRQLAAYLAGHFADNPRVRVVEGDFLELPLEGILPPSDDWKVVANLPYSVGTAIIRRLLEAESPPSTSTVMVQKEVAERMAAVPPRMSILSVAVQVFARARMAFEVEPGNFLPSPSVDSAVVVLERLPASPIERERLPRFFELVNAGFRHKRKTIANSIADERQLDKQYVDLRIGAAGIDSRRRAETLSVSEWVTLTESWPDGGAR